MIIAFTGTREGMSAKQVTAVLSLMKELQPELVYHGDCIGADTDFHNICILLRGNRTNPGYPKLHLFPSNRSTRAHNEDYDFIEPQQDPLVRDKDMAKRCDRMIACPKEFKEVLRSGTWTTRRYGIAANKIIYTFLPDGSLI